ncbi:MAG: biopolymer transporter ExbD [Nitrospinota bacterium]|nr:biopolymer transporter ExbD [Nitrospinota bacterium]
MKFRDYRRVKAQPGLTAMIDIVFLLLIFFVLSSAFVLQPAIKIKLPKTLTKQLPVRKEIVVIIARDKRVFINNKLTKYSNIFERFQKEAKKQANGTVVIRADRDVSHGFVVKVMDVVKQAGFPNLAIATEPINLEK